jgi:hypothetical protein
LAGLCDIHGIFRHFKRFSCSPRKFQDHIIPIYSSGIQYVDIPWSCSPRTFQEHAILRYSSDIQ